MWQVVLVAVYNHNFTPQVLASFEHWEFTLAAIKASHYVPEEATPSLHRSSSQMSLNSSLRPTPGTPKTPVGSGSKKRKDPPTPEITAEMTIDSFDEGDTLSSHGSANRRSDSGKQRKIKKGPPKIVCVSKKKPKSLKRIRPPSSDDNDDDSADSDYDPNRSSTDSSDSDVPIVTPASRRRSKGSDSAHSGSTGSSTASSSSDWRRGGSSLNKFGPGGKKKRKKSKSQNESPTKKMKFKNLKAPKKKKDPKSKCCVCLHVCVCFLCTVVCVCGTYLSLIHI